MSTCRRAGAAPAGGRVVLRGSFGFCSLALFAGRWHSVRSIDGGDMPAGLVTTGPVNVSMPMYYTEADALRQVVPGVLSQAVVERQCEHHWAGFRPANGRLLCEELDRIIDEGELETWGDPGVGKAATVVMVESGDGGGAGVG